jgi:hypothetical protein
MPSFTVPLAESNDCHAPAGSAAGGQFCSTEGTGAGAKGFTEKLPRAARAAMQALRNELVRRSFAEGVTPHENMGVVDLTTGKPVGELLTGGEDYVDIPPALQKQWAMHYPGPLVTAHTHPGAGGAFSWADFELHNRVNQQSGMVAIAGMHVYTKDGTWYELTFPKVFTRDEMVNIQRIYDAEFERAKGAAAKKTDAWAKQQPWWDPAVRPPKTWNLMNEREHIRHAAEKANRFQTLEDVHGRHFRDASDAIWRKVAAKHGIGYRSWQAPATAAA